MRLRYDKAKRSIHIYLNFCSPSESEEFHYFFDPNFPIPFTKAGRADNS